MKVCFFISGNIESQFNMERLSKKQRDKIYKIEISIIEKVNNKIFDIPYLPTKEMHIDLIAFRKVFNFNARELDFLEDNQYFVIDIIFMHLEHLELLIMSEYEYEFQNQERE
jgi:hypothetical protein